MNKKYINVAIFLLSVALLGVVLFGYFGHKKELENAKPTSSSNAQEHAISSDIDPSRVVDCILTVTPILYDTSDPKKNFKDEESSKIHPNVLVDDESEFSNVSSSEDHQESLCSLYEEFKEFEAFSKNQNYLREKIQAENNPQSEVENENFESSEEVTIETEKTVQGFQPADGHKCTFMLEDDVENEPAVSKPLDVSAIKLPKLEYFFPADIYELPCGYFKSSRGNAKILPKILITFFNAGSMEIQEEIIEKFDIINFICSGVRLKECLAEEFFILPSGIYETIGGEYEFEDGSYFLIPKGVKFYVPEQTIIQYPRRLDIKSMIKLAFDFIIRNDESMENKSWKQAQKTRN